MAPSDDAEGFRDLLFELLGILDDAGIEHLITGALVRQAFGQERTTQGFDLVVHPDQADPEELEERLVPRGYGLEGPTRRDLGRRLIVRFPDVWDRPLARARHTPAPG